MSVMGVLAARWSAPPGKHAGEPASALALLPAAMDGAARLVARRAAWRGAGGGGIGVDQKRRSSPRSLPAGCTAVRLPSRSILAHPGRFSGTATGQHRLRCRLAAVSMSQTRRLQQAVTAPGGLHAGRPWQAAVLCGGHKLQRHIGKFVICMAVKRGDGLRSCCKHEPPDCCQVDAKTAG